MTDKKTYSLSIYLHKTTVEDFEDCLDTNIDKDNDHFQEFKIDRKKVGTKGKIYISYSSGTVPDWGNDLQNFLTEDEKISLGEGNTNRGVLILKVDKRFMSVTFGYGKHMLDASTIIQDFGIKVAANMIDSSQIKSLSSLNIEDIVIDIQRQSSSYSNQNQLQVDTFRDILKEVAGAPSRRAGDSSPKFIAGTDSLKATKKMELMSLLPDLKYYLDQYYKDNYKNNNFKWLDNVTRVKDSILKDDLDLVLERAIIKSEKTINISANRTLNWNNVEGFFLSGMRKKLDKSNFDINIQYDEYFSNLRCNSTVDIIKKLKRDNLLYWDSEIDGFRKVSNVYQGINFECLLKDTKYLLTHGEWLRVDPDYYKEVQSQVSDIEKETSVKLIPFDKRKAADNDDKKYYEKHYNRDLANSNKDYYLLDSKNFMVPGFGNSSIEPCDVITRKKELIHVKILNGSSSMSHLLAQGLVSAQQLVRSDFQEHINKEIGLEGENALLKPGDQLSEYKVVFAIISDDSRDIYNMLPFFTMVNLVRTVENLRQMNIKYSVAKIEVIE
ncbi:TIGR04141 family sporadically distributed protein [Alkalibacterium thalassium]|uniref:Sporadically distributed protein, TIGR04141 family n=1 Tax=Alkalibacterium thalassium TaxID=426701 RepID=A0A1G8V7Q5_9LACT|nr:TIGR04141 family sporadically distributed protein [Alkalibacterium thalassium]SDJ62118.1 sporadically distributed protein, TIGR04141 family [Alkalibacterium thalassium]